MKKIAWFLFLTLSLVLIGGCSSKVNINPSPSEQKEEAGMESSFKKEKFENEGYEAGFKNGYEAGLNKALKILNGEYAARIKRMEAGKYLVQKKYITAPEVFVVTGADGSLSYKVKGCQIEKEFDAKDILERFGSALSIKNTDSASQKTTDPETEKASGFGIASKDTVSKLPTKIGISKKLAKIVARVETKNTLDEYNIEYFEREGFYYASFADTDELVAFCKQFNICESDK